MLDLFHMILMDGCDVFMQEVMLPAIKSKKQKLPLTKADQNTWVAWQLSWFELHRKVLTENKISYETKELRRPQIWKP